MKSKDLVDTSIRARICISRIQAGITWVFDAGNHKKRSHLNPGCHGDRLLSARRVWMGRKVQDFPLRPAGKHFDPHVPCKASFSKGAARFLQQSGSGAPFSGRATIVDLLSHVFYRRHRTRFVLHRIDLDADREPKTVILIGNGAHSIRFTSSSVPLLLSFPSFS